MCTPTNVWIGTQILVVHGVAAYILGFNQNYTRRAFLTRSMS